MKVFFRNGLAKFKTCLATGRRCRDAHLQALSRRALAGAVATLGLQDGTLGVRDDARVAGMTLGLRDGR